MVLRPDAPKGRSRSSAEAYGAVYQDDHCVLCGGGGVVHCTFEPLPERQHEIGGTPEKPIVVVFGCCRRCMSRPKWVYAAEAALFFEFGQGVA
jgi:hypothetical protein